MILSMKLPYNFVTLDEKITIFCNPKDMRGLPDKHWAKVRYLQLKAHFFIKTNIQN